MRASGVFFHARAYLENLRLALLGIPHLHLVSPQLCMPRGHKAVSALIARPGCYEEARTHVGRICLEERRRTRQSGELHQLRQQKPATIR